jgi:hypothetical protein
MVWSRETKQKVWHSQQELNTICNPYDTTWGQNGYATHMTPLGDRMVVKKQSALRFHMVRFNLKKLHKAEIKEKYYIEISNRLAALEDLGIEVEINSAWEIIRENIMISAKESKLS